MDLREKENFKGIEEEIDHWWIKTRFNYINDAVENCNSKKIVFLEYGCGIAPITNFLLNYSLKKNLNIDIADIRQINSHYAKYRFGNAVNFLEIQPFKNCLINEKYQVVFMITVMEHLPDPLSTVERVTTSLKSGGIYIFDYILGDGDGQDTIEAVTQREAVLDYIQKEYNILEGKIQKEKSMGKTVCRKK